MSMIEAKDAKSGLFGECNGYVEGLVELTEDTRKWGEAFAREASERAYTRWAGCMEARRAFIESIPEELLPMVLAIALDLACERWRRRMPRKRPRKPSERDQGVFR